MKRATTLVFLTCIFIASSTAQDLRGIPDTIRTPDQIVKWFDSDFQYQLKLPDAPQSPEETMVLKTGDCDDFAALASVILARSGIKSDVLIIRFKGLNVQHAICIWRNSSGTYDFISSKKLHRTLAHDIVSAVAEYYPDWEAIDLASENRDHFTTLAALN